MNTALIWCGLVAIFWGSMSVAVKMSGLTGGWVAIILATGTLPITLLGMGGAKPTGWPLIICMAGSILNGFGMLAFGKLVSLEGINISNVIPIAYALIPIVVTIEATLLLGESLPMSKVAALAAIAVSIYVLS
ncbi:MAG: hypothetical protein HYT37_02700 [Candidatus Sungbacteria bacterium]|nr:hypothetical protein [Candidatus Sungbacteria bacterium]